MKRTFIFIQVILGTLVLVQNSRGQTERVFDRINYQGRLLLNGVPANGQYEIQAGLFMTESNGTRCLGATVAGVGVSNGLLNAQFEFGETASGPVWDTSNPPGFLEMALRPQGSLGPYTTLHPRQRLSAALYAQSAAVAQSARSLDARANQPVTLNVNGQPALRLVATDPGPTAPINLLAGYSGNWVSPGSVGATISGGGATGAVNRVGADFATVGGGAGNIAGISTPDIMPVALVSNGSCQSPNGVAAWVGGGFANVASGDFAAVGGGERNISLGSWSFTGGGQTNRTVACWAVITGGFQNWLQRGSDYGVISGGDRNLIESNSPNAIVGGGSLNAIHYLSPASVVGGGLGNDIQRSSMASTIAGGQGNRSGIDSDFVFIGGGQTNVIKDNVEWAVISGGVRNTLEPATDYSAISGGHDNTIQTNSSSSTITGGARNLVGINSDGAVISGGDNSVGTLAHYAAIGGGGFHDIGDGAQAATISGGRSNSVASVGAVISGGENNRVSTASSYSAVASGSQNAVENGSANAFVGGGVLNRIDTNAPASSIGGGQENYIGPNNRYGTIPGGWLARVDNYGQFAYAHGAFASGGDAQTSLMVPRGTTTNATLTELMLDGINGTRRMLLRQGATWTFDILVTARNSSGQSAGYTIRGVIENVSGVTSLVGVPTVTALAEDAAAWNALVEADDVRDALVIKVQGTAGTPIRWVASVRTVEVRF